MLNTYLRIIYATKSKECDSIVGVNNRTVSIIAVHTTSRNIVTRFLLPHSYNYLYCLFYCNKDLTIMNNYVSILFRVHLHNNIGSTEYIAMQSIVIIDLW